MIRTIAATSGLSMLAAKVQSLQSDIISSKYL